MVCGHAGSEEFGDLVHQGEFTERNEEFVGRYRALGLEEGEPENLRVLCAEKRANFLSQVVVQDVLEINVVKVVGPRMEDLEALVLYALGAETLNIFDDEVKLAFVDVGRVGKIVLLDLFLGVPNKLTDGLDAS